MGPAPVAPKFLEGSRYQELTALESLEPVEIDTSPLVSQSSQASNDAKLGHRLESQNLRRDE
jgi:hypothetical protein